MSVPNCRVAIPKEGHTVLHETYETICETLSGLHPGSPPIGNICREADRFAAALLMQPGPFAAYAKATGFDVAALQKRYGRRMPR